MMIRFKHEHMQVYSRRRKKGKAIRMTMSKNSITQSAKDNIQENPISICNTQKIQEVKMLEKKLRRKMIEVYFKSQEIIFLHN